MAKVFALVYTILYGLCTCALLGLYVWCYFMQPYWKSNSSTTDSAKTATRLLFACATCYIICTVAAFIFFIVFLATDYDSAESIYFVFSLFYAVSLFLMLYVWIKRLESTFLNSAYELSAKFVRGLKYSYYAVLFFGFAALVGFIANDGGDDNQDGPLTVVVYIFSGLFAITFVALLIVLLYSFVSKLNQLRKVAENRLEKANSSGDYDLESIGVIQKLVKLQLKLTIAAILSIVSTFFAIAFQLIFNIDEEWEIIIYGADAILGFLCIHCTLKTHNVYYEFLCKVCIFTCDLCFSTTQLDTQMKNHIAVHSRSNGTTGGGKDGSSGAGTSIIITSDGTTTTENQPTQPHTARPSNNITQLTTNYTNEDNQQREMTDDVSNTQTND